MHLECFDENRGFAEACNRGVAAGSGEIVVLLNNDVDCHPDFLERLVAPLATDPRVGSVAALMLQPGERLIDSAGLASDMTLGAFPRLQGLGVDRARAERPLLAGPAGTAAAYRRSAWEQVGGLDETMFAYMEDFDLALRLRSAGWKHGSRRGRRGRAPGLRHPRAPLRLATAPRRLRTRLHAPPLWPAAEIERRPARSQPRRSWCLATSPSHTTWRP